ncbi:dGTP triphosphohydrolase [Streptococcus pneumoniae]|nr:dGTP triphosphohydrolase [Streptococcus pneumoniae]
MTSPDKILADLSQRFVNRKVFKSITFSQEDQDQLASMRKFNRFYFPKEMLDQNSIFASITQQFLYLIENDHFTPNKN